MLCGAMIGKRQPLAWNQGKELVDFFDAKGAVEAILAGLGITGYVVKAGENPSLHPGKTAIIKKDNDVLGMIGEVHPGVLDAYEITKKVYVFELNIAALVKHAAIKPDYQSLPKFPAITRDLAVILPADIPSSDVTEAIVANGGSLLTAVQLFDVYTGQQVAKGFRSLAFSLTFQANDRTLTDIEIDEYYKNIVASLESAFSAKLRM